METIFNWFDEKYLEERELIIKIIDEACIKHACSVQSLFESCQMMKHYNLEKNGFSLSAII